MQWALFCQAEKLKEAGHHQSLEANHLRAQHAIERRLTLRALKKVSPVSLPDKHMLSLAAESPLTGASSRGTLSERSFLSLPVFSKF